MWTCLFPQHCMQHHSFLKEQWGQRGCSSTPFAQLHPSALGAYLLGNLGIKWPVYFEFTSIFCFKCQAILPLQEKGHTGEHASFSSKTSEEPREFHSWINIVIPSDGQKSQARILEAQGVLSGVLPSGPSAGSSSWRVPGTSPGLLPVESLVLKSDLIRALMNALGIQSSR